MAFFQPGNGGYLKVYKTEVLQLVARTFLVCNKCSLLSKVNGIFYLDLSYRNIGTNTFWARKYVGALLDLVCTPEVALNA